MKKQPLWQALLVRDLFSDEKTARSWIMAGRVLVDNRRIDKPGFAVTSDSKIDVKGLDQRYVSRGGLKLEGALRDFHINVTAKTALDAGASTGGFTDCLLQHGAAKVYAVDVGYGQLAGKLRADPRVVVYERMNIGSLLQADLDPLPTLATLDLSYLSLRKGVPIVWQLMAPEATVVCLVKPLFEIESSEARRSGIIRDAEDYAAVLHELIAFLTSESIPVVDITHSRERGSKGTFEFFLHIRAGESPKADDLRARIVESVRATLLDEVEKQPDKQNFQEKLHEEK